MQQPLRDRVIRSVVYGVTMAGFYCVYVLALYLARGNTPFERVGYSLPTLMGLYVFGGVAGGAIVGVLLPLAKWRLGASLIGALAGLPLGFALYLTSGDYSTTSLALSLVTVTLIGGMIGMLVPRRR